MVFSKARNGSQICSLHSVPLHSAYNPEREAEKFVASLNPAFPPRFVIITEPAISYTAQFLRQRFPEARLFAVRYCTDFQERDFLWDGTFCAAGDESTLKASLFGALGEEGVLSAFFCAWPPSSHVFADIDKIAWRAIRDAVHLSRDVMATRTRFASRWILNAFSLCVRMRRAQTVERGTSPIVVASSGASLKGALPHLRRLKEQSGGYFLIALSSALSPIRHAGLQCDLVLTTDGGFYAGRHLEPYLHGENAPLAIAAEGYCPAAILEKAAVVPLVYPDGPSSAVLRQCAPNCALSAERNGTVSGTALRLALCLTAGNVYFCGLDMAGGMGHQHCPPNVLETDSSLHDTRLRPLETRTSASRFSSASLEIYRQWFASLTAKEVSRVYRLSDGYKYENTLGHMQEAGFDRLEAEVKSPSRLPRIVPCTLPSIDERRQIAQRFVEEHGKDEDWLAEIFPAERLAAEHSASEAERGKRLSALQEKNAALIRKIHRVILPVAGRGAGGHIYG